MKITKNIVIIIVIALLANAGLYMNAGYFSHDEIGWGLKAISAHSLADINFYNIFNYTEFHYRPLNFNLWLLTSYYLFDIPQVFHLVLLCFGIINAILIYLILRKLINYKTAFWAALLSTMMPSVVFVNGWIGTIADIFWFMFCSLSFLCFISIHSPSKSRIWLFCVSVIFFIMALMFKETAVIYPGVIFLYLAYNYLENEKSVLKLSRYHIAYFIVCSFVVIGYLLLRFDYLFPSHGGGYATSLSNIPQRVLEYFIYPFLFDNIEIHGLFEQHSTAQLAFAFLMHIAFIIFLCKRNIFHYLFYILFYYVGSVPILILDMSLPHYIYTSGFVVAFGLAVLFYRNKNSQIAGIVFFIVLLIHSLLIQWNYLTTGTYQNTFTNSLYAVLSSNKDKNCQYIITPDPGSKAWIAVRAISFRHSIYDLELPNNISFDSTVLQKSSSDTICHLKLDVKGLVKVSGEIDDN